MWACLTFAQVIFTPIMNREQAYNQLVPIKINLNPRYREFTVTGKGDTPKVRGIELCFGHLWMVRLSDDWRQN